MATHNKGDKPRLQPARLKIPKPCLYCSTFHYNKDQVEHSSCNCLIEYVPGYTGDQDQAAKW